MREAGLFQIFRPTLFQGVFEFTAWAKLRHSHGWDFDFLAGLWVAAHTSLALGLGEGSETDQGDIITLLHALLDGIKSCIQNIFCVHLGHVCMTGYCFDQLGFVHFNLLEKSVLHFLRATGLADQKRFPQPLYQNIS